VSVDPKTSLIIVREEIKESQGEAITSGWLFSGIDEPNQIFTVTMVSPLDKETYVLEVKFDNYRLWPLYLEFIDPLTHQRAVKRGYPRNGGMNASFFHDKPCICHPCSRKAYANYGGPHGDWGEIAGWLGHPQIGGLTAIPAILRAIYCRISREDIYRGRMNG
jgi:hypothetical protein